MSNLSTAMQNVTIAVSQQQVSDNQKRSEIINALNTSILIDNHKSQQALLLPKPIPSQTSLTSKG